jgi:hypothetical protein
LSGMFGVSWDRWIDRSSSSRQMVVKSFIDHRLGINDESSTCAFLDCILSAPSSLLLFNVPSRSNV